MDEGLEKDPVGKLLDELEAMVDDMVLEDMERAVMRARAELGVDG